MTKEEKEKELLLKDLCSRLPYEVKVKITPINTENFPFDAKIIEINTNGVIGSVNNNNIYCRHDVDEVKPYLFPLSSMTAEQLYELRELFGFEIEFLNGFIELSSRDTLEYLEMIAIIEWFNKNHFDYRDLIEKGLAIDCTNLNIY